MMRSWFTRGRSPRGRRSQIGHAPFVGERRVDLRMGGGARITAMPEMGGTQVLS